MKREELRKIAENRGDNNDWLLVLADCEAQTRQTQPEVADALRDLRHELRAILHPIKQPNLITPVAEPAEIYLYCNQCRVPQGKMDASQGINTASIVVKDAANFLFSGKPLEKTISGKFEL